MKLSGCAILALAISCGEGYVLLSRAPAGGGFVTSQLSCAHKQADAASHVMLFGFGGKKEAPASAAQSSAKASSGRPTAGAATRGSKKTAITQEPKEQSASAKSARPMNFKTQRQKAPAGVFTPEQFEKFTEARKIVPSGGADYWQKVASYVPGQTADTCKQMASQTLFDKAVGTKKDFWKSYVEVIEVKDYVDEDADIMGKLGRFFGGKK